VRAATALLDAGASANTGWYEANDEPRPFWESVIYGAAGIARHIELTRLLLDRGADPNDGETPYHVPETYNNAVMKVLVESGKLNEVSMTTLLTRKADWHDDEGIRYLLEHGADPNHTTVWRTTPFQHAIRRDNGIEILRLMLDFGADPSLVNAQTGRTGVAMAARRGHGDVIREIARRGLSVQTEGVDRLVTACALAEAEMVEATARAEPVLAAELVAQGGTLLAEFSGNGNTEGVRLLLDLGVSVSALYPEGDGYFEVAKDSTALHVAAWRARHDTVGFLIGRGAEVNRRDAKGQTPLALAIRACVDSYWKYRRTTDSIEALLRAGAALDDIEIPTGYPEADALLLRHRGSGG
jgi:ankyrin repeat protein